jgi:hypothetical protein
LKHRTVARRVAFVTLSVIFLILPRSVHSQWHGPGMTSIVTMVDDPLLLLLYLPLVVYE